MSVGPCTCVTHQCHTPVSHTSTHAGPRGWHVPPFPPGSCLSWHGARVHATAELSRARHGRTAHARGWSLACSTSVAQQDPGLGASGSAGPPRSRGWRCLCRLLSPGCGARGVEVLGMDLGVLGRSHGQRRISKGLLCSLPAASAAGAHPLPVPPWGVWCHPLTGAGGEGTVAQGLAPWGQEGVFPKWSGEGWCSRLAACAGGCCGQPWPEWEAEWAPWPHFPAHSGIWGLARCPQRCHGVGRGVAGQDKRQGLRDGAQH